MSASPSEDPRKGWPALAYAPADVEVRCVAGKWQLRCAVRRKWVALEPEEWVRQHVVAALVASGWPLGRMVLEHPVRFGQVDGRIDIACFDLAGRVELAVEVKAPQVPLDARVAEQVGRYDLVVKAAGLMITNGLQTFIWERDVQGQPVPGREWPRPGGG